MRRAGQRKLLITVVTKKVPSKRRTKKKRTPRRSNQPESRPKQKEDKLRNCRCIYAKPLFTVTTANTFRFRRLKTKIHSTHIFGFGILLEVNHSPKKFHHRKDNMNDYGMLSHEKLRTSLPFRGDVTHRIQSKKAGSKSVNFSLLVQALMPTCRPRNFQNIPRFLYSPKRLYQVPDTQ